MRSLLILLALMAFSCNAFSQLSPFYAKHYSYDYAINPAISGRDNYPVVNLTLKQYMFGVDEGAPLSVAAGTSMRLGAFNFYNPRMMLNKSSFKSKSRMGLGTFLLYEQDGPLNYTHATFSYAYYLPLNNEQGELSFGLSAQLFQYGINQNLLDPLDAGDEKIENMPKNSLKPEAGFGVYYHNNQLQVGLSANDLLLIDKAENIYDKDVNKRDFFAHGGYTFFLHRFELEPTVFLAKIDEMPFYYFTQTKIYYMNYNWIGVAYKSTKTLSYSFGIKVNRLFVAYIYEHSISEMIRNFGGAHEIMIGINIGLYEAEGIRKVIK